MNSKIGKPLKQSGGTGNCGCHHDFIVVRFILRVLI